MTSCMKIDQSQNPIPKEKWIMVLVKRNEDRTNMMKLSTFCYYEFWRRWNQMKKHKECTYWANLQHRHVLVQTIQCSWHHDWSNLWSLPPYEAPDFPPPSPLTTTPSPPYSPSPPSHSSISSLFNPTNNSDRQTDKQTDKQMNRQINRWTDRHTER